MNGTTTKNNREICGSQLTSSHIVISLRQSAYSDVFRLIDLSGGTIEHMETRGSRDKSCDSDMIVKMAATHDDLDDLHDDLKMLTSVKDVKILRHQPEVTESDSDMFPRHVSEIFSREETIHIKDMTMPSPSLKTESYDERRLAIGLMARKYKWGDDIPRIQYTTSETDTWSYVYRKMRRLSDKHACTEYLTAIQNLEKHGVFSENSIPQLQDVSDFIKRRSGFRLCPAYGLISPRDFLASLAFRVFRATQYTRHPDSPEHTTEPDCIHELIGHAPMLANPTFARFSQEIGLASLGASDEDVDKLSTLYWFTVEFGVCQEDGETKVYGAGIMSSEGELNNVYSNRSQIRPLVPAITSVQDYTDQHYQPIYFTANNFQQMIHDLRQWLKTMKKPYHCRYDPYTESISVLRDHGDISLVYNEVMADLHLLQDALQTQINCQSMQDNGQSRQSNGHSNGGGNGHINGGSNGHSNGCI